MRIGILSDAHGNILGLDTCLKAMKQLGVNRIVYLGDAVGYLPYGSEVASRLMNEGIHCLLGNHEAMVFGLVSTDLDRALVYKHSEYCHNLPKKWCDQVARNGSSFRIRVDGLELLFVHASPNDPLVGYVHPDEELVCSDAVDFVFMGHTHRPFQLNNNGVTFVNVGSSGLPRDHGSLLSFAILDSVTRMVELFRVPLDVKRLFLEERMGNVHQDVVNCFERVCIQPVGTLLTSSWDES